LCRSSSRTDWRWRGGSKVKRISDKAVVKYGFGVTAEEAKDQHRAYQILDKRIVRIPKVHQFFEFGFVGYLVMEYIFRDCSLTILERNIWKKLTFFSNISVPYMARSRDPSATAARRESYGQSRTIPSEVPMTTW